MASPARVSAAADAVGEAARTLGIEEAAEIPVPPDAADVLTVGEAAQLVKDV